MASITCVNCGEHRSGPGTPSNTKRCRICSTENQLDFVLKSAKPYKKKCEFCSRDFTPYRRDEKLCADCDVQQHINWRLPWDCITCGSKRGERNKVLEGIPICKHCFQDPEKQPTVNATLNAVILQQREANGWVPEATSEPKVSVPVLPAQVPKPTGAVTMSQVIDYLIALKEKEPDVSVPERRAKVLEGITSITLDKPIEEIGKAHGWSGNGLAFLKEPEWEALINVN